MRRMVGRVQVRTCTLALARADDQVSTPAKKTQVLCQVLCYFYFYFNPADNQMKYYIVLMRITYISIVLCYNDLGI